MSFSHSFKETRKSCRELRGKKCMPQAHQPQFSSGWSRFRGFGVADGLRIATRLSYIFAVTRAEPMEHLPMPKGAVLTENDMVPYLASTDYVGIPFLLYPQRKGFYYAVPRPDSLEFARYESIHPTPDDKLGSFLQTWLFFGLLQEVFGDLYQHSDFIRSCESDEGSFQVLTTAKLPILLCQKFPAMPDIDDVPTSLAEHLKECVKIASNATTIVSSRLSRKVSFSILATLETLSSTFNSYFVKDFGFPLGSMVNFSRSYWIDQMSLNGWCAREAAIASEDFHSAQALHYLSKMAKSYIDDRHRNCRQEECVGMQIDLAKYEPQHCDRRCDCANISIDLKRLNSILESGNFPLLSLEIEKTTGELKIDLVESTGDACYVALSHVWADGLGNPFANSLAKCQLLSLQNLAREVLKASNTGNESSTSPALLWLDTLCVPCEPGEGKAVAMSLMRSTYQKAHHVLVLESSLRCYDIESTGLVEAALRIFTSPWLRRLWCLQEGALAKRLWFQFQDRPVELAEIFNELGAEYKSRNFSRKEVVFNIMSVCSPLRLFIRESAKSIEVPPITLDTVSRALRHRRVSVASDEAICLANLFDLSINVFTGPHEGRMCRFWGALCESQHVPSSIIFSKCSKLREEGFRWAPKMLLDTERRIFEAPPDHEKPASFCPRGLLVHFPGVLISRPRSDIISSVVDTRSELPDYWHLFDQKKAWWHGLGIHTANVQEQIFGERHASAQTRTSKQENTCAIIFSRDPYSPEATSKGVSGLFVTIKTHENGVYYARLQNRIVLVNRNSGECSVYNRARKIAQSLPRDEFTKSIYQWESMDATKRNDTQNRVIGALRAKMDQAAEEALKDPAFRSIHDACFPLSSTFLIATIWNLYIKRFTVVKEWLPHDTLWCVD